MNSKQKKRAPLGADTAGSRYLDPDGHFPNHVPNPELPEAMDSIRAMTVIATIAMISTLKTVLSRRPKHRKISIRKPRCAPGGWRTTSGRTKSRKTCTYTWKRRVCATNRWITSCYTARPDSAKPRCPIS